MLFPRTGAKPVSTRVAPPAIARAAAVPVMAAVTAALLAGGCSNRPNGATAYTWPGSPPPYHVAAAPPVPRPAEMEDDGREAQMPPPRSIRQQPDDPSEPYSRNYGSAPARQAAGGDAAPPPPSSSGQASVPVDSAPYFRRRMASAVDTE